jgi:hypothetical protein
MKDHGARRIADMRAEFGKLAQQEWRVGAARPPMVTTFLAT